MNGILLDKLALLTSHIYARMRRLWGILAMGLLLSGCQSVVYDQTISHSPRANTNHGRVEGIEQAGVYKFLGMPYAAAPIGDKRFRAPQAAAPWTGIKALKTAPSGCIAQKFSLGRQQSEDCLYLNLFVPAQPSASPRPVMVWLHGGGLIFGSGLDNDPTLLAKRQNVIVVSINYRLGALGFFAHPQLQGQSGEGAFGLQDQAMALQWVKDNIHHFGGDANNITVFGESAGSWSICYHLFAPHSKGLFQRAIMQSGSCLAPNSWLSQAQSEQAGLQIAKQLSCQQDTLNCLRKIPAKKLMHSPSHLHGMLGPNTWSPMVGGDVLPQSPEAALAKGEINAVPLIIGSNKNEGNLFSYLLNLTGNLNREQKFLKDLSLVFGDPQQRQQILEHYQALQQPDKAQVYAQIISDGIFACPTAALIQSYPTDQPIYHYQFDDPQSPFVLAKLKSRVATDSYHTAELLYVFQTPWLLAGKKPLSAEQQTLSNQIQSYWGNFAKTGQPNAADLPQWQAYPQMAPIALSIEGIHAVADFKQAHQCGFWQRLNRATAH